MASELVSDNFGATDTDIIINNVYNVGIPPTFKDDGIRKGDGLISGSLTVNPGNLIVSGSTSGSITSLGPSGSVHINNLGSGSISASGFLFAKLENNSNTGLKTVMYNTSTGKFFTTGSYGGGGGGSVVISTVSDTTGQTGIDFTLSSGDLSAVVSGLDTDDDVAFAQVSASGNLFANLPDGFQNVATYNSQSGQLFFTSSQGLFDQLDTFRSKGQRNGDSGITGSLHLTGSTSDLKVDGTVGIGTAAPTTDNVMLHIKSNYSGSGGAFFDPIVIIEGETGNDHANLQFKNDDITWSTGLTGAGYSDSYLIRDPSTTNYPFAIDPSAAGNATHPLLYLESNKVSILGHINANPDANLLVSGNLFISGPNGHITASGDISASGTGSFGRMLIGPQPINSSDDYMFSLYNGGSTDSNRKYLNLYRSSTYFFQLSQYLNLNWRVNGSVSHNIYNTSTGATNPLLKLGHSNSGIAHITTYNDDNSLNLSGSHGVHVLTNLTASGNISASGLLFASASLGFESIAIYNSQSGEFHYTSSQGLSEQLDTFKVTGQRNGDSSITGSLTVTGTITAQEFHTEFISSSIIFTSGSTQFGNSADDVATFSGSINVKDNGHITASGNISASGTGSFGDGRFSNKVGINTLTPSVFLHIKKPNSGGDYIYLERDGQRTFAISGDDQSTNKDFSVKDITAGTRPFLIAGSTGNVGINTQNVNPGEKLTVHGNISASGNLIVNQITASGDISASGKLFGGLTEQNYANVVYYNTTTGELTQDTAVKLLDAEGVISSSAQVLSGSGVLSSSTQIATDISGAIDAATSSLLNSYTFLSSSNQIATDISGSWQGQNFFNNVTQFIGVSAVFNTAVSGAFTSTSSSIAENIATNLANIQDNAQNISTNTANIAALPTGNAVSGSFLLNTTDTLTGNLTVTNHITASGNITASNLELDGRLIVNDSSNQGSIFHASASNVVTIQNPGQGRNSLLSYGSVQVGNASNISHITASGNISASGKIFGGLTEQNYANVVYYNTSTGELTQDTAVKLLDAEGVLSSSTQIAADISGSWQSQNFANLSAAGISGSFLLNTTDTLTGNLRVTNDFTASHVIIEDSDTPSLILRDTTNPEQFKLTQANSQATIDITGGAGGITNDLAITTDHRTNHIFVDGGTGDIYLGGHINVRGGGAGANSAAHITASGNISASGNMFAKHITLDTGGVTATGHIIAGGAVSASTQLYGGLNNTVTDNIVFYNTVGGELTYGSAGDIGGGLISSSAQVLSGSGTFSSSAQIATDISGAIDAATGSLLNDYSLLSSSVQIAADISGSWQSQYFNTLSAAGISGSWQSQDFANLSAAGISGSFLLNTTDTLTGNLTVTNHITASGNIIAKGATSNIQIVDTTNNYVVESIAGGGPRVNFGDTDVATNSFMAIGSFNSINQINTKNRDFHLYGTNTTTGFYFDESAGKFGIGTTSPAKELTVEGDISASGETTTNTLRLTSTTDASATSTGHAFQAGLTTGANVIIDNNEVMARNNGAVSTLHLNPDGGQVTFQNNEANSVQIDHGNVTASNNISASGNLFADVTDSSDTNFKTVVYDTATGQFFRTGSYGGGGGGFTAAGISGSWQSQNFLQNVVEDTTPQLGGDLYAQGNKIYFDTTATYIYANTNTTEDLLIGANDDIILQPDDDVLIQVGASNYAIFDGGNQRFGIGDTNPESKAHIEHTDTTTNSNTNTYSDYLLALRNDTDTLNAFAGIAFDVSTETDANSIGAAIKGVCTNATTGIHATALTFHTNDSGDDGILERMRIDDDGRVYINTNSFPGSGAHLQVGGAISASNGLFLDNIAANLNTSQHNKILMLDSAAGSQEVKTRTSAEVVTEAGGLQGLLVQADNISTQMFGTTNPFLGIDFNGGTNIGVSSTGTVTSVVGSATFTTANLTFNFQPGGAAHGVYFNTSSAAMNQPTSNFTFNASGNNTLRVGGDVVAFASDKRLKENIVEIPNPIEKIKQLRGVYYDWKDKALDLGFKTDYQHNEIGLIAQELEEVIPQAVTRAPFDNEDNEKIYLSGNRIDGETEPYKTIKMDKVVPLLIEAVKDQQKQIEELKELLNKLTK